MGARERKLIAESIRELNKDKSLPEIERGKVVAVNLTDYTIDVDLDEGAVVHDVQLSAVTTSNAAVIEVPKKNSYVVIAKMEQSVNYVLLRASAIDKWLLKIGNTTFEIDGSLIKANGGNNHGLVKIVELTEKLNAIETKINTIITALKAINIAAGSAFSGSAFFTSLTNIDTTIQAQIEDTKFTH